MEEKYPCPKMTPLQRIVNFWYYYKWFVLVGIVFLALIVIATVQYFKKDEPDIAILYAGPTILSDEACDQMTQSCENLIFDLNADGTVSVSMKAFVLNANEDLLDSNQEAFKNGYDVQLLDGQVEGRKIQGNEEFKAYNEELLYGESCLLLLDEALFNELAKAGFLVNLKDALGEDFPASAVGEFGVRLVDTKFCRKDGFTSIPFDTVVCLKTSIVMDGEEKEDSAQKNKQNIEIFRELID